MRKSNRTYKGCTKSDITRMKNFEIESRLMNLREDNLFVKLVENTGRSVFTNRALEKGEPVLEYKGELIDSKEAKKRERQYSQQETIGCFMLYFDCTNKKYCIDATREDATLGRLVKHEKKIFNLKLKVNIIQNVPRVFLYAARNILIGEELSYDYGERSKLALLHNPWLAK